MAQAQNKVPVLNNMAMCLTKQGMRERSLRMLEQVLQVDPINAKALARKLQTYLEMSQFD